MIEKTTLLNLYMWKLNFMWKIIQCHVKMAIVVLLNLKLMPMEKKKQNLIGKGNQEKMFKLEVKAIDDEGREFAKAMILNIDPNDCINDEGWTL